MPGPVDTARALAALLTEHGLSRLTFEGDGCKITLERTHALPPVAPDEPAPPAPSDEEILFASAEGG